MQIRRFFCSELSKDSECVQLNEAESAHALRVLRLGPGDRMQLLNGRGLVADAELMGDKSNGGKRLREARCHVLDVREVPRTSHPLTLCVALPRGRTFDLILKSATELGVAAIQPLICHYGVARPEENSDNWSEVLVSAVKQSANPWMPSLLPVKGFSEAIEEFSGKAAVFGASPAAEATAAQTITAQVIRGAQCVWIGPEGGFAPEEEARLLENKVVPVTIGSSILRIETAVPAVLGFLAAAEKYLG